MKSEGNRVFKDGNYAASIVEYTQALKTCPLCYVKERSIMYSNRAAAKLHLVSIGFSWGIDIMAPLS